MRAALDLFDPKALRGDYDLGFNAAGVHTRLIIDSDYITTVDTLPAPVVEQCMREVAALSDQIKSRRPGGHLAGKIPFPIWQAWRKQWASGPKAYGLTWRAFFNSKFMDSDYRKFRAGA